ncbi:hypothetical protein PI125_g11503 [Phytophthora idaei]|nr:hypothetical protein PI125_g11503 [Phytophthora idaei]
MEPRRAFARSYETYLTAINALQTRWGGAFAMPWISFFLKAKTPTHFDYVTVDIAMRELKIKTDWPEPESRMMNLQAVLKAILDRFNLVGVVFEREQKRLENTRYRTDVVAFCSWVTSMIREFFMWEQAALQYCPELQRLIWWSPCGANSSLVARGVLEALQREGKEIGMADIRARPHMLWHLVRYVEEKNTSSDLAVGRPVMQILGYFTDDLLVRARDMRPEWFWDGLLLSQRPDGEDRTTLPVPDPAVQEDVIQTFENAQEKA